MPHRLAIIAALVLALAGCSAAPRAAPAPAPEPRAVTILRGDGGAPVPWEALVAEAAAADVVVIGENHGHPLGLAAAAALFEDIIARAGTAALSMEFFERDEQSRLDDYLAGLTDERAFRARTRRTDAGYPPGHRAMVEAAKRAGRPVVAANAPRPYVSAARRESYDRLRALTPEQQRLFRIPDALPEGRYRRDFNRIMSGGADHEPGAGADGSADPAGAESPVRGHPDQDAVPAPDPGQAQRLDALFRAQSLWDWTMAESIARAAETSRPVVHVVGRFHSDFGGGLIQALGRLRPGLDTVTISFVDEWSASLRDEDRARAAFVIYAGPAAP